MSPLRITSRSAPTGPVLAVVGELDYEHAAGLRQEVELLTLRPGQRLTLDLAGMEFCDSSGIAALLAARQHAQTAGAEIALASVPAGTLRVLSVVGLDQVFALLPDTDADAAGSA
ncbi:STAS domain-containing protein [Streptomyces sp. NPDC059740]|uniref:STAS domain-containing protein n=1 Tax=Streptomyces sp. NPDC059740 TaxID=3346926 RepID=UPI003669E7D2